MAPDTGKTHYNSVASDYVRVEDLPHVQLEYELITRALQDCTNLKVLDLGGGNGVHARRAIDHNAAQVDVIDISAEMMQIGKDIEMQLGRSTRIHWYLADITQPLASQLPSLEQQSYHIIMANWVFDDTSDPTNLEAMWKNVSLFLAPGGKVIVTRVANVFSEHIRTGKYGYVASDIEKVEGGIRYKVTAKTTPPFSFPGAAVEDSFLGKDVIPAKFGFKLKVQDPSKTEIVKADPEYWKEFVETPNAVVVIGRKS